MGNSIPSIFDLLTPEQIADVQNRTKQFVLDAPFAQAVAEGGAWFAPSGYYQLNQTWGLKPGFELRGAGMQNTVVGLGGNAGAWGAELLNANGTDEVEAPKFYDLGFQASQNGIRWNRIDGGYTDDTTTQAYMMRPIIERCYLNCDSSNPNIGLQFNKCFNTVVRDCVFNSFGISVNATGSDMVDIVTNRFQYESDCPIVGDARYPFGSSLRILGNDFNNPKNNFVRSSYIDTLIGQDNHIELDSGSMQDALHFDGDACMHIRVRDNRVQLGTGLCKNWISVTPHPNRFLVDVHNNTTSGPMGDVNFPAQYYFNNAGSRSLVSWGNNSNTASASVWPMNTEEAMAPTPAGCAAYVTAGRPGVAFTGLAGNLMCAGGDFVLPYNPDPSAFMEISDWGSSGAQLPGNNLTGKLNVVMMTAAGMAGLQGRFDIFDGSVWMEGGFITHTTANRYQITSRTHNFSVKAVVRFSNIDATHQERFYSHSTAFMPV